MVVTVSDGSLTDTIIVTINVTDSNESSTVGTVGDSGDQQPEQPQQPEAPGGEEGTPTLIVSTAGPLTEATVDGGVVALLLSGGAYERSISAIREAVTVSGIAEVTVNRSDINRVGDTVGDGRVDVQRRSDHRRHPDFHGGGAGHRQTTTGPPSPHKLPVTALAESLVASPSPLRESSLNGSVVALTLTSRPYERSISAIREAVTVSGIAEVTVNRSDINRVGDTVVTVELTFSGDLTTDGTLTFTVGGAGHRQLRRAGAHRTNTRHRGGGIGGRIPVSAVGVLAERHRGGADPNEPFLPAGSLRHPICRDHVGHPRRNV